MVQIAGEPLSLAPLISLSPSLSCVILPFPASSPPSSASPPSPPLSFFVLEIVALSRVIYYYYIASATKSKQPCATPSWSEAWHRKLKIDYVLKRRMKWSSEICSKCPAIVPFHLTKSIQVNIILLPKMFNNYIVQSLTTVRSNNSVTQKPSNLFKKMFAIVPHTLLYKFSSHA